jgi:hypothetical protein
MPASRTRLAALVWVLALITLNAQARTLEVGEGKTYKAPSLAAVAARDGDVVKIYPGEHFDCAVWQANKLVVEGVGAADKIVITDKACNGKALFITTGADVTIRNLTLTRARVPDANGAGIRGEGEMLLVEGVRFINDQNGILSGFEGSTIIVRDSVRPLSCATAYLSGTGLARRHAPTAFTSATPSCCASSTPVSATRGRATTLSREPSGPRSSATRSLMGLRARRAT